MDPWRCALWTPDGSGQEELRRTKVEPPKRPGIQTQKSLDLSWNPTGNLLAQANTVDGVAIWDTRQSKPIRVLSGFNTQEITAKLVRWSPDGSKLAVVFSGQAPDETENRREIWMYETRKFSVLWKCSPISEPLELATTWKFPSSPLTAFNDAAVSSRIFLFFFTWSISASIWL